MKAHNSLAFSGESTRPASEWRRLFFGNRAEGRAVGEAAIVFSADDFLELIDSATAERINDAYVRRAVDPHQRREQLMMLVS